MKESDLITYLNLATGIFTFMGAVISLVTIIYTKEKILYTLENFKKNLLSYINVLLMTVALCGLFFGSHIAVLSAITLALLVTSFYFARNKNPITRHEVLNLIAFTTLFVMSFTSYFFLRILNIISKIIASL